jgi:hypothetical protein
MKLEGSDRKIEFFCLCTNGKKRQELCKIEAGSCNHWYSRKAIRTTFWPLIPKFAGSNPAEAVEFFGRKNPQHDFLRRGSPGFLSRSPLKRPDHFFGPSYLLYSKKLGPFPGVKWPRCNVDNSPPSSGQVKNKWSYKATPRTPSWRGAGKRYIFKNIIPVTEFPSRLFPSYQPKYLYIMKSFRHACLVVDKIAHTAQAYFAHMNWSFDPALLSFGNHVQFNVRKGLIAICKTLSSPDATVINMIKT